MGLAVPLITGGATIASGIIAAIAAWKGSQAQIEATERTNMLNIGQADIERGIREEEFGERVGIERGRLGISKGQLKLGKERLKLEERFGEEDRAFAKEKDEYNKVLNFITNFTNTIRQNPTAGNRLLQIQQQRRAA